MPENNADQPEVKPGELDPEIWNNPTLGAATNEPFLDQVEMQTRENRNAAIEGRPARIVKRENRYPGFEVKEPNSSPVEFGNTYEDGSKVVPVLPPTEEGYTRDADAYTDNTPSETKAETSTVRSTKLTESKPTEKKSSS